MRTFTDVPVLCGHRGSGKGVVEGHRENTLPSFAAAVRAGMRWVEVDARLTADDVLVARHDPAFEDGRHIGDLPAAETDELGVMRVADLLEALPPDVGVDVDVKSSLEDALRPRERTTAARVAGLVAGERGRRPLLVTTFDAAGVAILRERLPDVPLGLLTWARFPLREAIPAAVHLGADVVAPHVTSFPLRPDQAASSDRPVAHSVGVAHAAGLQVLAWGSGPEQARLLVESGVDCLVVDDVAAPHWSDVGAAA